MYFGEIGPSSKTVISYFKRHGARSCSGRENPAEWMLAVTGATPGSECTQDWSAIWNSSENRKAIRTELARMKKDFSQRPVSFNDTSDPDALRPFAAPFGTQLWIVLKRVFQQYWRTPSYLYSKLALCLFSVSLMKPPDARGIFDKRIFLTSRRACSSVSPFGKCPIRFKGFKIRCLPSSCYW